MATMFRRKKKWILIATLCISICSTTGCLESSFHLASESRLPQGVTIPPGRTRSDVTVTMDFIGMSEAKFTMRNNAGKKLATVHGKAKGNAIYLKTTTHRPDPHGTGYQLVVINGITEIVECRPSEAHENMEKNGRIVAPALFYVIDDPAVKQEVLATTGVQ
jgi:hypothetical protein